MAIFRAMDDTCVVLIAQPGCARMTKGMMLLSDVFFSRGGPRSPSYLLDQKAPDDARGGHARVHST